jgi:hypothetical protein
MPADSQSPASPAQSETPDAPQPHSSPSALKPCPVKAPEKPAQSISASQPGSSNSTPANPPPASTEPATSPCPPAKENWYKRFTNGPQVKPLTPGEKAWLATRNLLDPFNVITILGDSGIAVGSDSHSAYGPGWPGFARNVGVSFTQDMTGEFFGTFAIPSIVHQDPHYHREPHASIRHRIGHAVLQVVWTQGDNGKPMLNYANLVGFAIDDEIGNLYVPGRETDLPASAERYATGLASAPIDNFVSEFLPDVASHVHVQVVVIQRIINQVARSEGADNP